jgi:hypothetical protein
MLIPELTNLAESYDGEFGSLRLRGQLSVVHADKYHPFPEQS